MNQKGYAIIEIIIVGAILAIFSSMIVPKINDSLQSAKANYLIESLYSELRYIQALSRLTNYDKSDLFQIGTKDFSPYALHQKNFNYFTVRLFNDSNLLRKYIIPENFYFNEEFSFSISTKGIPNNSESKPTDSGRIILKNNSKICKPVIVYDSVGRLRFGEK